MATNRIDILDQALLRPGRIDRKIEFPNPNDASRLDILKIHSRKMNLTRGIDLKKIAESMSGASGAEMKGCCTEAGAPLLLLSGFTKVAIVCACVELWCFVPVTHIHRTVRSMFLDVAW